MPRLSATTCILLCFTALSACSAIGPESIRANRADYNQAIQQTNDQELLLNIVRIRYRDTLYFTTVERIAATQQLERAWVSTRARRSVRTVSCPCHSLTAPFPA
jgi:hypothetical protein